MDLISFGAWYLGATAGLLFILLFGESPFFQGTPVEKLHWLVTSGWIEGAQ